MYDEGLGSIAGMPIQDCADFRDLSGKKVVPQIREVQAVVSQFYGLTISDLKSVSRKRELAIPRQIAASICRDMTRASYPQIAMQFGSRHHTTILFGYRKIKAREQRDPKFAEEISVLRKNIFELAVMREMRRAA